MLDEDASFEGWQRSALCRDHSHPHWWTSDDLVEVEHAKAICMECSVRVPCIISAVTDPYTDLVELPVMGVYAGMSRLDMLMDTWKRISDVSESNWSAPDKVIETVIKRAG
jgi:hypothetical protein